jgi:hypothetical protein
MNPPIRGWPACVLALAIASLGCAASAPAHATIWRCGNTYSDRPCAGATPIEAPAAPSEQERRQADEATRNDQAAAERMARERLRLEAAAARRGAVIISHPTPTSSPHQHEAASASKGKKPSSKKLRPGSRDDEFVASGQAPARKTRKKKSAQ